MHLFEALNLSPIIASKVVLMAFGRFFVNYSLPRSSGMHLCNAYSNSLLAATLFSGNQVGTSLEKQFTEVQGHTVNIADTLNHRTHRFQNTVFSFKCSYRCAFFARQFH